MAEIEELPRTYAAAAVRAAHCGFSGVELHAGHGFLLSQFLSPLFNNRNDSYGGSVVARAKILVDIINQIRLETGPDFAIGVKLNSTDQLEGGLTEDDALDVVELIDQTTVDIIDISGGTYFPGAPASTDRRSPGPYFIEFGRRARAVTDKPLMLTGGFKTQEQASEAITSGATDFVGLARALALDPDLATKWTDSANDEPRFPTFSTPPIGGVTAWYTMRLTALSRDREADFDPPLTRALSDYEQRDQARVVDWNQTFAGEI